MRAYFIRIFLQHFAFGVTFPVVTVFWLEKGLTLTQIALMSTVFAVTSIASEIPTGFIADRFGRKASLVLASFVTAGAFGIYSTALFIPALMVGAAIEAIGFALMSGADEAFVFDTLKSRGQESSFMRMIGRLAITDEVATIIGMVVSSLIVYLTGTLGAFYFSAVLLLLTGLISLLTLQNPRLESAEPHNTQEAFERRPVRFVKRAWAVLRNSHLISMMLVFALLTEIGRFLWQPQMLEVGIGAASFGIIFAALKVFSILGSYLGGRMNGDVNKSAFVWVGGTMAIGMLTMAIKLQVAVLGALALLLFVENIYRVLRADYINQRIESHNRATVLSINNMATSLFVAVFALGLGHVSDNYGIAFAFVVLATVKMLAVTPLIMARAR